MFCNNCGSKLPEDSRFCTNCGTPVPAPRAEAPKMQVPVFAPAQDLAEDTYRPRPAVPVETPKPAAPVPVYSAPAGPAAPAPVQPEQPEWNAVPVRIPPATKKSGISAKLIVILVLVAALVGTAVWGFADGWLPELFEGERQDRDRDEDDEDEDEDEDDGEAGAMEGESHLPPVENAMAVNVNGMTFYLDENMTEYYNDSYSANYYTEDIDLDIMSGAMEDVEADVGNSREFAEFFAETETYGEVEYGKNNGITYIIEYEDDAAVIYAFYVEGDTGWIVQVEGYPFEEYRDLMIQMATSGELS